MTVIPKSPEIDATITTAGSGTVSIDGEIQTVYGSDEDRVRAEVFALVAATAFELGRAVRLHAHDSLGDRLLAVYADGHVEPLEEEEPDDETDEEPEDEGTEEEDQDEDAIAESSSSEAPVVETAPVESAFMKTTSSESDPFLAFLNRPDTVTGFPRISESIQTDVRLATTGFSGAQASIRNSRASFLVEDARPLPASQGWRGLLAKTGIQIALSESELAEREDVHSVSQHWAGPRTIAIVNGKGGANKTPTTAMLSALFARNGGAGVLAWDNNETRGTLGWRTEQGPHDAVVHTLLPATERLLSPGAQSSDFAHFVHHQTSDKYDVLRSNPTMLASQQRLTADNFDSLHSVAAKYYRLIFIDSGNDESAEGWLRMIDHTDQLVIATTALGEHAEAGALLLEALSNRDERSAQLAANAVVIVSQSERNGRLSSADAISDGFSSIARRAVSIPFDLALHGGQIRYDSIAPATRRAWLAAAAAVADGL